MIKDLENTLDLVISRAPKLRAAGVLELEAGNISFKLAAADAVVSPVVADAKDDDEPEESNPWNDPATFGRSKGVPGKDPKRPGKEQ